MSVKPQTSLISKYIGISSWNSYHMCISTVVISIWIVIILLLIIDVLRHDSSSMKSKTDIVSTFVRSEMFVTFSWMNELFVEFQTHQMVESHGFTHNYRIITFIHKIEHMLETHAWHKWQLVNHQFLSETPEITIGHRFILRIARYWKQLSCGNNQNIWACKLSFLLPYTHFHGIN